MDVGLELIREDFHCVELWEGTKATLNMHGSTDLAPRGLRQAIFFADAVMLMPQNIFCLFLDIFLMLHVCFFTCCKLVVFPQTHEQDVATIIGIYDKC
jgi:hypothetical protein